MRTFVLCDECAINHARDDNNNGKSLNEMKLAWAVIFHLFLTLVSSQDVITKDVLPRTRSVRKKRPDKPLNPMLTANQPPAMKAQVILHIGPHKTGSTYIQQAFNRLNTSLYLAGYCWDADGKAKKHHLLATHLYNNHKGLTSLRNYPVLFKCLNESRKVIISSETFSAFANQKVLSRLKGFFAGHSVHVVAAYREPLSLFYSIYTEVIKNTDHALPFGSFLLQHYKEHWRAFHYDSIRHFERTFGREHLTVVDYYGVLAADRDIAQVLLCEVIGILCDAAIRADEPTNARPNMIPYNIFHIVRNYIRALGCSFHGNFNHFQAVRLIRSYADVAAIVPVLTTNLGMLAELSRRIDEDFRKAYGSIMLYDNRTAAVAATKRFSIVEVDESEFLASAVWSAWLRTEGQRLVNVGLVGNCSVVVSEPE